MTARFDRFRDHFLHNLTLGFSLDVSCIDFSPGFFEQMEPRMQRAYATMAELERGAIANPDENRKVGHYWLRRPEIAPDPTLREAIVAMQESVKAFAADVHEGRVRPEKSGKFKNLLVIGIGGSALGPQYVSAALGTPTDKLAIFFFDNTDPDGFDRILDTLEGRLDETLSVVISKSGGTKETRNGMLEAEAAYRRAGLTFAKHAVAITGEGSELDMHAEKAGFVKRFPMWDWVGGRTSELSAVGLLPAALQGFDIDGMLKGAREMDEATRDSTTKCNPAALLALAWFSATGGVGKKDMVILPYKDRLELFSRYLQQLVMESLGKEDDLHGESVHQGIAVYGNKGSTDQHAYVQQLRDGLNNFFATFIEVLEDRNASHKSIEVDPGITSGDYLFGFLYGTRKALRESGRESLTITVDRVDGRAIGQLIALYERAVGFYASLVNVNAYHQPGVEAGKKAAQAILDLQTKVLSILRASNGKKLTVAEVARSAGSDDEELVFVILRHLTATRGVRVEGVDAPLDARYFIQ